MQEVEDLWMLAGQNWMLLPPDFVENQIMLYCQREFSCQALLLKQLTMLQIYEFSIYSGHKEVICTTYVRFFLMAGESFVFQN